MTVQEFKKKVAQAPELDFGDLFSRALDLFQKVWLQGLLVQVLSIVISYGVMMILYIPLMASAFVVEGDSYGTGEGAMPIVLGILLFVLYLIVVVVLLIFNFAIQSAFFRIVRMKDRNISYEKGTNLGMFLKKKFLKKAAVTSLAIAGIAILAALLCVIPIFYIIVPLQFATLVFAFHPEWSINDILKAGFELGNKKWGISFALLFVAGLVASIVGMLACFIGIYATASFALLPSYLIYKDVIGFTEDEDLIAQIGG